MKITVRGKEVKGIRKWNFDNSPPPVILGKDNKIIKFTVLNKITTPVRLFIDDKTYYKFKAEVDINSMTFKAITKLRKGKVK